MNKFKNDSIALEMQNAAFDAAKDESIAMDLFLEGKITEKQYENAMESTSIAVQCAVNAGVPHKDLPAV